MQPPCKTLHILSLCNTLNRVRSSLLYVKNMLDVREWDKVRDTVAHELATVALFLGNVLDSCILVEHSPLDKCILVEHSPPSFLTTSFTDKILQNIQVKINDRVDFWKILGFWKHYPPYQPQITTFANKIRDITAIDAEIPIVHDIFIPVFNLTCDITARLADMNSVDKKFNVLYIL